MRGLSDSIGWIAGHAPGWLDGATAAQSALAGTATVLGSYAAVGFTPALVVGPVESFLVEWMPGAVIGNERAGRAPAPSRPSRRSRP